MRELAAAHPEKAWLQPHVVDPPREELWHGAYWQAWYALRYDRAYVGQMGIEMPISFLAVDRYAQRNGIDGEAFERLQYFLTVIDDTYLEQSAADRTAALANPPKKT